MSKGPPTKHARVITQIREIYALYQQGQLSQAQTRITKLLTKEPKSSHAHTLAAMIAQATDQPDRAMYHATSAIKLDPNNPDALTTLASIQSIAQDHQSALSNYTKALELQPDHPGALSGLGSSQSQLGHYAQARVTLKRVQERSPELPDPLVNRALLELDTTHAARAIEILDDAPAQLRKHPAVLDLYALAHSYDDSKSPQQILNAHKDYGDELEAHIPPASNHPNLRDPSRKIRVGYLSGDLHRHSISYFLEPILEHRDPDQIETHLFTTSSHRDEVTERLDQHADHWHVCSAMTLPELTRFIQSKQIDILVELTGHFAGHKLPVLAAKPAPIQITFIGYGNTTGLSRIDTRFVDEITDPAPDADALATETLVRLPGCFLCYRPPEELPEIAEPTPGRPLTLGSFNNLKKLSDPTITVWSRILSERPDTRLLIKSSKLGNPELRDELTQRFAAHGINADRLDLRSFSDSVADHLDTYNQLDLALDTFPYTGTTTTCESLAMGVPVLTLLGNAHAGRVSASLLSAAGMTGMVARDHDDYIAKAIEHIDQGLLSASQRRATRDALIDSDLCDQIPYTRGVEDAYRTLWTRWCTSR